MPSQPRYPPTKRRLREARERGDIAYSRTFSGAVILGAGLLVVLLLGGVALREIVALATHTFAVAGLATPDSAEQHLWNAWSVAVGLSAPFLLIMLAVAVAVALAQVGFSLSMRPLLPSLSRLFGGRRLPSADRMLGAAMSVLIALVLIVVTVVVLVTRSEDLARLPAVPFDRAVEAVGRVVLEWSLFALAALAVVGVLDIALVRSRHRRRLMMTREELERERRELEGDPVYRGRRKEIARGVWDRGSL